MVRSAFFACLMLFALVGAASGQAFLTVHNNTDATLAVFVVSRFQAQDMARPVTVPPVTAVRFAVEMGLFELIVDAPKVGSDVGFRRQISFLKRRRRRCLDRQGRWCRSRRERFLSRAGFLR